MSYHYYYNESGEFSGFEFLPDDSSAPLASTLISPEFMDGFRPVWDGEQWVNQEDHRGHGGYIDGQYTKITELGPLPEGWSTNPPPPPEPDSEQVKQARIWEIDALLAEIDRKSIRSLRSLAEGEEEAKGRLDELEAEAVPLRAERFALKGDREPN
jgi:hypothetical protein